jgi:hypothetical protein
LRKLWIRREELGESHPDVKESADAVESALAEKFDDEISF